MGFAPKSRKRFDVLCVLYLRRILPAQIVVIVVGTYCNFAVTIAVISACVMAITAITMAAVTCMLPHRNAVVMLAQTMRKLATLITVIITVLGVVHVAIAVARAVVATNKKGRRNFFRRLYFFAFENNKIVYTKKRGTL